MDTADALPVGVVRIGAGGAVTDANDWFCAWLGLQAEHIIGRPLEEFLILAHDDLFPAGTGPGPWVMLDRREPSRAVMVARHTEGANEVLVMSEASERWRALSELRRSHVLADRTRARLQLVMDSSVAFSTANSEEQLATILADTATRAYRAEHSAVYLHHADGTSTVAAGLDPFDGRVAYDSLIKLVSVPRRIIKVVGTEEGDRLLPGLGAEMRAAGVQALIAAPLHHEMDFGAFVSWFHHVRTFDEEAAPLAEALAGQAAQALATLRLQNRLAHAATHDDVTGLPNRRLLESQLPTMVGTVGCATLFIDLDGFKEVNDRLGHHAGDRLLYDAGQRLLSGVREGDMVARYGGDEFVIVCPTDDAAAAMEVAQRVLEVLHGLGDVASTDQRLHASIGVAFTPAGSTLSPEHLIRAADMAMYEAKTAGGDRVVLADGLSTTAHAPKDRRRNTSTAARADVPRAII